PFAASRRLLLLEANASGTRLRVLAPAPREVNNLAGRTEWRSAMSSVIVRLGLLLGLGTMLVCALAAGQERKPAAPAGRASVDVFNPIEARLLVVSSKPDGSHVEKGELLCELDPRDLQDRLTVQEIVVRAAEAEAAGAVSAREAAEITSVEYSE